MIPCLCHCGVGGLKADMYPRSESDLGILLFHMLMLLTGHREDTWRQVKLRNMYAVTLRHPDDKEWAHGLVPDLRNYVKSKPHGDQNVYVAAACARKENLW